MNEDDMAARHIEPNLLVEMESLTEGSNVAPTASGFNSRPYNVLRGSFGAFVRRRILQMLSYHDRKNKTPRAKSIPPVVRSIA